MGQLWQRVWREARSGGAGTIAPKTPDHTNSRPNLTLVPHHHPAIHPPAHTHKHSSRSVALVHSSICTIVEKCHVQQETQKAKPTAASSSSRLHLCIAERDPLCQPCECSKNVLDPRSSCPPPHGHRPCTVSPIFTPESESPPWVD